MIEFITIKIVEDFVKDQSNSELNKLANPLLEVVACFNSKGILARAKYKNYGYCMFQFSDFDVYCGSGMHQGFDVHQYQTFVAKALASEPGLSENKTCAEEYIDELEKQELTRHKVELKRLRKMKSEITINSTSNKV